MTTYPGVLVSLSGYVAIDRGFFKAEGLDVTLVPVTSGPGAAQAVITGSADVATMSPDQMMQVNDKGQNLKIICGNNIHSVSTVLARDGWPLPHAGSYPAVIQDLKGAKIGVTALGSLVQTQFRIMLQEGGLNPDKDVTFVATGGTDTSLAALKSGQIDVWSGTDPGTTIALDQMKAAKVVADIRTGQGPSQLYNFTPIAFSSTDKFIQANGDRVKAFVAAMSKAIAWMKDAANRSALTEIVAKNMSIDTSIIPGVLNDNLKTFGVTVPQENIANAIAMVKQEKLISGSPTYDDLVATQYVPAS